MFLDKNTIKDILHHRDPFLFVDTANYISKDQIETSYFLSNTHAVFDVHFPGNPIMPGVLLIEAIAQSAGILIIYNVIQEKKCDLKCLKHESFLVKVNTVKFKKKITPDSTITIKVKLSSVLSEFYEAVGQVYVDQKLAAVGSVTLYFKLLA